MQISLQDQDLVIDLFAEGPVEKSGYTLARLRGLPSRRFDAPSGTWIVPYTIENWDELEKDDALYRALEAEGIEPPTRSGYRIERYKNLLSLSVPPSPDNIQKCRAIPEYRMWNDERKAWVFRATRRNIEYVRAQWPGIRASKEAADLVKEVLGDHAEVTARATARKAVVAGQRQQEATATAGAPAQQTLRQPPPEVLDYKFGTTPFAHQKTAFALSRDMEAYAFFMEQGTGKTKVAIDTAAYLYTRGKITGVLVVCPNAVKSNWAEDELPTHLPPYVQAETVVWKAIMSKPEQAALDRALGKVDATHLSVLVMNVEAFSSKRGQEVATKFVSRHTALTIVDESSRIKTPGAKRTKAILKIGRLSKYRRILTGTPVTQGPLDVFAQFKFLDDRILGFSSFYSFRNHFAIMGGFQGRQVIAYANLDELQRLLDPYSFRVTKDECLDLPPKVYQKLTVDLSPEQKRLYKAMRDDMLVELGGAQVSVTEVIVQMLRLQQITGGFLPKPAGEAEELEDSKGGVAQERYDGKWVGQAIPIEGPNPKLEALVEALSDVQGKAIVWARFRAEIDLIARTLRERFGDDAVVEFHGGVDEVTRTRHRKAFQDPASPVRFFVGQTETGGIGLTLTQARTVVYYSNSFNLESRLQSEDRAHRIGQEHSVTYIDLVARGTLDARLLAALRDKKSLANAITGDAWKDWV